MTYTTPQMAPGQQYGQQPSPQQQQQYGQQGVSPMGIGGGMVGGLAGREIGNAIGGNEGAAIGGILGTILGAVLPMQAQQSPPQLSPQSFPGMGGQFPFSGIDPEMLRRLQEVLGQVMGGSQQGQQGVSPSFFGGLLNNLPTMPTPTPTLPPILQQLLGTQGSLQPFQAGQGGQLQPMEHVVNPMSFWSKVAQYGMQYGLPVVKQLLLSIPDQPGQQQGMQQPMQPPMQHGMQPPMPQPMQPGQAPAGVG
ncbi:hypothetical protein ACTMTF_34345 [Nonomuraea sp. ZG12]|uniref:hypothetical protein n=1 Tax=Nonomuraea sp. ZG12 TaxID=3452207 RepID=UPI003F8A4EE7